MVAERRDPPTRPEAKQKEADILMLILQEQRQTNHLLALLIDAMAEAEGDDGEAEPLTYMDGTPVR